MRLDDLRVTAPYQGGVGLRKVLRRLVKIAAMYSGLAVSSMLLVPLYYLLRLAIWDDPYPMARALQLFLFVVLCNLVFLRRFHRRAPFFTAYIFAELSVFLSSPLTHSISYLWVPQLVLLLLKGLALGEMCWQVLGAYRGIWALAWRALVCSAILAGLSSYLYMSGSGFRSAVLTADAPANLMVLVVLTTLLLFARYYSIPLGTAFLCLANGFFLLSAFSVIKYAVLRFLPGQHSLFWNFAGTTSFIAALLVWTFALSRSSYVWDERKMLPAAGSPRWDEKDVNVHLAPTVNARLRSLNERLNHIFWGGKESQP